MPVIEALIDGLGILGIAVVIGDAGKPSEQIGGEQQRSNYGDRSGAPCEYTHAGYRADNQAHGAVPECAWKLPAKRPAIRMYLIRLRGQLAGPNVTRLPRP